MGLRSGWVRRPAEDKQRVKLQVSYTLKQLIFCAALLYLMKQTIRKPLLFFIFFFI